MIYKPVPVSEIKAGDRILHMGITQTVKLVRASSLGGVYVVWTNAEAVLLVGEASVVDEAQTRKMVSRFS
jgi:hypothetical protein